MRKSYKKKTDKSVRRKRRRSEAFEKGRAKKKNKGKV